MTDEQLIAAFDAAIQGHRDDVHRNPFAGPQRYVNYARCPVVNTVGHCEVCAAYHQHNSQGRGPGWRPYHDLGPSWRVATRNTVRLAMAIRLTGGLPLSNG